MNGENNLNAVNPADLVRMQKDKFDKKVGNAKGWQKDKPHPLYDYIAYGDMVAIASIAGVTENYVRMLLRGTVNWEPLDNKRGDTKRRVLWKAQTYIWTRIQQGATQRNPRPKQPKGKRKAA